MPLCSLTARRTSGGFCFRDDDACSVRKTFRRFVDNGVAFTIATDGLEMMRTHLRDEFELLLRIGALDEADAREANARGHDAAFARSLRVGERA